MGGSDLAGESCSLTNPKEIPGKFLLWIRGHEVPGTSSVPEGRPGQRSVERMAEGNAEEVADSKAKVPLGLRLKAWWEGYNADDLLARDGAASEDGEGSDDTDTPCSAEIPLSHDVDSKDETPHTRPKMPWNDKRVEMSQFVWGKGYCGPGGPEQVVAMSKLLALTPEMSVLVLGAELGGPTRTLAKEFGAWISGYESSAELVEAGNILSEAAGLSKKAHLHNYNFDKPAPLSRHFDRVFSKEALFAVKDLKRLVATIEPNFKGDGLWLLTDYVLGEERDLNSKEIREWRRLEPKEPHPVTAERLVNTLKDAHLNIRVNEDISDQYIKLIADSWNRADQLVAQLLARGDEGKELVETLLHEAEFWMRRSELLKSGKLRLWRIVAHKKVLQNLMSDW